jgi:hypothetical protein
MTMDYREVLAKMREIIDRDGLDVHGPEAESKLFAAATKELEAEGEKCTACEPSDGGDGCIVCGGAGVVKAKGRKNHECTGEKCDACSPDSHYNPLAGATSFAEADSYEEANKVENHIREQEWLFRQITNNIFGDAELSLPEKLAKVKAAATELEDRLEKPADKGLLDRVMDFVGLTIDKKPADMPAAIKEAGPGAFTAFKDAQGNWRWMTLTSNMWRDRDGEIIPGDAHEGAVSYAERTKDMPDLRLWHVPGSRIGVADWVDFTHGFVLHSGSFDKGMEDVAESLATTEEPLGVSHGFYHNKAEDSDTYPWYRDFEVSVLPLEKAANQWTEFTADNTKEVAMGLTDERRGFLVKHIGEGRVTALEKLLEEKEEDLKSGKVDFKEVLAEAIEAAPAPDPKPAEGKGGDDAQKDDDPIAKLVTVIEAQGTQLTEIATAQAEQGEQIKALQASDDEKIAAKMAPQRQPPADGERPTDDKGNVLTEAELKAKGIDPSEALDSDELEKTPGGRALKQIAGIK